MPQGASVLAVNDRLNRAKYRVSPMPVVVKASLTFYLRGYKEEPAFDYYNMVNAALVLDLLGQIETQTIDLRDGAQCQRPANRLRAITEVRPHQSRPSMATAMSRNRPRASRRRCRPLDRRAR